MWFLRNVITKELICKGFSSQAKLAQFMGMNPKFFISPGNEKSLKSFLPFQIQSQINHNPIDRFH